MTRIKLELEEISILRPKKKWQLYFIVVSEHPDDPNKMLVGSLPDFFIRLRAPMENIVYFEPDGEGVDGLSVIERNMPEDRSVRVRLFIRHSRKKMRDAGEVLEQIKKKLGSEAFKVLDSALGSSVPWLEISKQALPLVGNVLSEIKDRDLGMIVMDEVFGSEFENQTELDRENTSSTGEAYVVWNWSVAEPADQ